MTTPATLSAFCEDETGAEAATAWRLHDGEPADIVLLVRGVAWIPATEIVLHARDAQTSQPALETI